MKMYWRYLHWLWRVPLIIFIVISLLLLIGRFVPVTQSSFMLQQHYTAWLHDEPVAVRQYWVDYEEIPATLGLAAIAAEDQHFPEHYGIDTQATLYAIRRAWAGSSGGGGSTLTQQLVKNLFLWPGRSYVRKAIEWVLAVWIELLWDKQRILEVYLNVVQFGRVDYGVAAASKHLLGKELDALTRADAALLMAVLPAPERYSAKKPSHRVRKRQRHILKQMRQLGGVRFLEKLKQ